ncbi:MAG: hypothetical protein AAGF23_10675, partial [Acidobacteriota bacterium]
PGERRSLFDCGEVEGVFSDAGRNAKGAEEWLAPRSYTPLLSMLFVASDEPFDLDAQSELSVAIRHIGGGRLQFAILDRQGKTLESGTHHHFESCRNGVLEKVWTEALPRSKGWLGTDEKRTDKFFVNADGLLVLTSKGTAAGLFLGFPIVGGSVAWREFASDDRFDIDDVDF